ncbi:MAG: CHASE domain-containing protein, partial [Dokdonella sp.]
VYFTCVVLLVAVAAGFFALRSVTDADVLQIRSLTAGLTLIIAFAFARRAREGKQRWSALIGVIVVLMTGLQLALFISGSRLLPVDTNAQVIAQTFAAGMFCVGAALIIDIMLPARWGRHLLIGLLGAIVAGIGTLGLFGLVLNAMNPLEFGPLRGMRLPSVLILLLCGLALLSGARLLEHDGEALSGNATDNQDVRDRTGLSAALVMLVVALGTTALTWREATDHVAAQTDIALQASLARLAAALQSDAVMAGGLLDGLRGFFAASETVERKEWTEYLGNMRLAERYPALVAVVYVRAVRDPVRDSPASIAHEVEGELQPIWPYTESEVHYPIVYIAPVGAVAQRLIGYDVGVDRRLRATIEAVRASGSPTLSTRIDFAEFGDTAVRSGYALVAPVIGNGSVADRTDQGYVYAVSDIGAVVSRLRRDADGLASRLRIIDDAAETTARTLYADADFDAGADHRSVDIELAGRRWTVQQQPLPEAIEQLQSDVPYYVLLGGSLCALVLFVITWILAGHRARAMHLAAAMTSELRKSQRAQQAITDTANAGIITADSDG